MRVKINEYNGLKERGLSGDVVFIANNLDCGNQGDGDSSLHRGGPQSTAFEATSYQINKEKNPIAMEEETGRCFPHGKMSCHYYVITYKIINVTKVYIIFLSCDYYER